MDVQGFVEHLALRTQTNGDPLVLQTAKIHISNIAKIEFLLGNLIRKGMERRLAIYNDLTNVTNDAERNENQVKMGWIQGTSPDTISAIRNSIKEYRKFLGDFPNDAG